MVERADGSAGQEPRFPPSKFRMPAPPSHRVSRHRLYRALDSGRDRRLTLVVGSSGAGKSVLVTAWLTDCAARPAAWLACDSSDADQSRFLAAMIEALRRGLGRPGLGEDARELLAVDGYVSPDVLGALIDDLEYLEDDSVLAIDDFHLAGPAGTRLLGQLLEHLPRTLQVVLSTRVDPDLRLHRLRVNDELVEVRDKDLAFSLEEASELFDGLEVSLDDREIAHLCGQSEGWAAGLQMAAIRVRQSPDTLDATTRAELRGRTIAGYFLEEVLYQQPPDVIDFMLSTSVLDELSPASCAALVGPNGPEILERIYRANLFLILLDEDTQAYRFHHLIRDVLASELRNRDPARAKDLHARAAEHLRSVGDFGLAARQLVAAEDQAGAIRLMGEHLVQHFGSSTVIGSVLADAVQPELYSDSPELLIPLAAELLLQGESEMGARAMALLEGFSPDYQGDPELAVKFNFVRSAYLYDTGQMQTLLAGRQEMLLSLDDASGLEFWLGGIDASAFRTLTAVGRFDEAKELIASVAARNLLVSANDVLCPGCSSIVALLSGELEEAGALAARTLDRAGQLGFDRHYFSVDARRALALVHLERRDFAKAEELIEDNLTISAGGRPMFSYMAQLDRGRIWAARGNFEEALASLPAARASLRVEESPVFSQADELEARLRSSLGDRAGAETIAEGLPPGRREVVLAMLALGDGDTAAAAQVLKEAAPLPTSTVRQQLESQLLQAGIAVSLGSPSAATHVRVVVNTVERHGFVQTVLDTAPPVVEHLIVHADSYPRSENVDRLISAGLDVRRQGESAQGSRVAEPLTAAEINVLERLPLNLTYLNMASELHLSLNTIKTHVRHVYMKLGVSSRSAAVKRAASLGLI